VIFNGSIVAGIFESTVTVSNSLFIKDIQAELRKMPESTAAC
jgi:hypothetical protein